MATLSIEHTDDTRTAAATTPVAAAVTPPRSPEPTPARSGDPAPVPDRATTRWRRADDRDEATPRWSSHRWASAAIRAAALLVPALAAAVATWVLAQQVPRPVSGAAVLWWAMMLAVAALVFVSVERAARRLLPLAALLRLSLVLPDQTASRYRIALRAGTTRRLREVVEQARAGDLGDTPAESAERVLLLVAALNSHDRLTRGHSERVRAYAEVIGEQMGLPQADLERLRWAALLHDVGKIAVPGEILNKKGRLTDDEFEVIKTHPAEGAALVEPLRAWLGDAIDAVGQHHERWDGKGYPAGIAGVDIGLAARIVSVADTFDVITSTRSYKKATSPTAARREIARCAGSQFDPKVTRALIDVSLGRLWLAGGPLSWAASLPLLAHVPTVGGVVPALGNAAVAGVAAAAVVVGGATAAPEPVATEHAAALAAFGPAALHHGAEGRTEVDGDPAADGAASAPSTTGPAAAVAPDPAAVPPIDPAAVVPEAPAPADTAALPAPTTTAPPRGAAPAPTTAPAPTSDSSGGLVSGIVGGLPLVDDGLSVSTGDIPIVGDVPIVGDLPTVTVPPLGPVVDDLLGGLLGRRR